MSYKTHMQETNAFAPGRVELLGNHTDYNEGYVLSAAIQFGVRVKGHALDAPEARVHSASMDATVTARLENLTPREAPEDWANYVLGVAHVLRGEGHPVGGFFISLESDLPIGAGLSSSAAVEVATAKFLSKLFALDLPPLELAKLCRRAENEFVGVSCGLLDQVSSTFGRDGHIVYLDCREETIERVPFPAGLNLLITHSGVKHALVGGEYNERREQCLRAAELLGVRALRDTSLEQLAAGRATLPEIVYRRALHIVGENTRVQEGIAHLRCGDGAAFGALMSASHESSRVNFENSAPELDALVRLSATLPGVLGSRLTGGGFGGATVSLVESGKAQEIADTLAALYKQETGNTAQTYLCKPSEGVR